MRSRVPGIALRASKLLQKEEAVACCCSTAFVACQVVARGAGYATAKPTPPPSAKPAAKPSPDSPTAAAQAAANLGPAKASGSVSSNQAAAGGSETGSGGSAAGGAAGGGGGWVLPVLTISAAAGTYYAYTQQPKQQQQQQLDTAQKAALDILNKGKETLRGLLPAQLGGGKSSLEEKAESASTKTPTKSQGAVAGSSSTSSDKLSAQKQLDAQESGFRLLPPGSEDPAAAAAAADAATAASAAARDSLSAAADEFPGSTSDSSAAVQRKGAVADADFDLNVQHIDITPITDLLAEVGIPAAVASPNSPSTTAAAAPPKATAKTGAAAAAAPASEDAAYALMAGLKAAAPAAESPAATAAAAAGSDIKVVLKDVDDSQIERLCRKLGLARDLAPAGLVAAANKAGLGASSNTGTPVPPQMAQLNQATADARLLAEVLSAVSGMMAQLKQQVEAAKSEKAWTEEAAKKSEASLTEHFKELISEQTRIHQQLTEAAVKQAEARVMADAATAHAEERRERLKLIDELRSKVNSLAVAFEQRTAQLKSAHEVNKVSLGMLALSKALEEGTPIGPQLQQLTASCPDDPLVEAVAASLPASAAASGLPTTRQLQQRFSSVAQAAAEAAYFSGEAEGGVLARLTAKLAAKLKVDAGADVDNEADSKLSQARALLQNGQLLAAADALTAAADGTQAAAVVQQWVADARARAVADQAVKLLQAHATATAAATS